MSSIASKYQFSISKSTTTAEKTQHPMDILQPFLQKHPQDIPDQFVILLWIKHDSPTT
jgi:hypothetical protein